jgi:heme/copper-type cytochrome/quinol oxidase subunit 3
MIFFITSEALIFANLIASYLYLEIRNIGGLYAFRLPSQDYLNFVFPLFNTFVLLASSIPVRLARAVISRAHRRTRVLVTAGRWGMKSMFSVWPLKPSLRSNFLAFRRCLTEWFVSMFR